MVNARKYRKSKTNRRRRRGGKKMYRKRGRRAIEALPRSLTRLVKFHYSQSQHITATATNIVLAQFRNNDLYDPDVAGNMGNGQPNGFDQWVGAAGSGKYRNYRVVSWKMYWTVHNFSSAPAIAYFCPHHSLATDADTTVEVSSFPNAKQIILDYYGGSKTVTKFKGSGTARKLLKSGSYSTLSGDVSTSPAELSYSTLLVMSPTAAALDTYVKCHYIFTAELSELSAVLS